MKHLGPHISYRRYPDRTILIDHRTRTTYELNDAAGETLDRLDRGESLFPDEEDFLNELRNLGLFDLTPAPPPPCCIAECNGTNRHRRDIRRAQTLR